ncbi:AraC-type DNA-binding protein [Filimonas lacunae]|uniref:AraC-type DNA-binding protein n=1 Tax=Filimonas lacunae TaxID=477680 RepID=A0A173M9N0_9BACT|nr:helix-turn-helix domain-containing protein [Filimonas lacunae]BAV04220.1 transcriptional regulator, AraC family [Filimonas lacunae]SIT14026.1 AraC-type DNA-binding protein [Filimonas lacunae]
MQRRVKVWSIEESIQHYLLQSSATVKQVGTARQHTQGHNNHFAFIGVEGPQEADTEAFKNDHYTLALCMQGSGMLTLDAADFAFQQGSVFLVPPQHTHSYRQLTNQLQMYCILFSKEFLNEIALKEGVLEQLLEVESTGAPVHHLPSDSFMVWKAMCKLIDYQYRKQDSFSLPIIRLKLVELLYELQRVGATETVQPARYLSRSHQLVNDYHKLVEEQFQQLRTVQEYAGLLHVSPKYLSELVKSETGETALHVIHRRIYREAQYLLHYTQLTIKAVADQLNFDTPSHFSRFFKQFAGYNPSEVKKETLLPAAVQ